MVPFSSAAVGNFHSALDTYVQRPGTRRSGAQILIARIILKPFKTFQNSIPKTPGKRRIENGQSVNLGEWIQGPDGYWALRFGPGTLECV